MPNLIQLIYGSAASHPLSRGDLESLLTKARFRNLQCGITGMLLYADGSFLQVLEGEKEAVDCVFESIKKDKRHSNVTLIIREPIARRSFSDWTMGFADIEPGEADQIAGINHISGNAASLARLGPGRARKLLSAFKQGHWRSRVTASLPPIGADTGARVNILERPLRKDPGITPERRWYSFSYQPIVDVKAGDVFSYEALIRGSGNEPAGDVLQRARDEGITDFDKESHAHAIKLAASLGIATRLNLNFLPSSIESSSSAVSSALTTAEDCNISADRIVLEVLESEIIQDLARFKSAVDRYRAAGVLFAIDDFGAGYAGLNLLADFQPDVLKLDMNLVRDIERRGPRQAIVRGVLKTCSNLGIDVVAEGVETEGEYLWLKDEGIFLFQGRFFAEPGFESLPSVTH